MASNHSFSDLIEVVEFESGGNLFMTRLQSAIGSFSSDDSQKILPIHFVEL